MKRFQVKRLAQIGAASAIFFAASSAFAIGPSYQYIPDTGVNGVNGVAAPLNIFNDVVSLGVGNFMQGTGTVIGATIIPINGTTSDAVLSILTALHVTQTGINQVNFGAGPNAFDAAGNVQQYILKAPLNPTYKTYTIADLATNPNSLPEDLAVMQANYYFTAAAPPTALNTILNNNGNINNKPTVATIDSAFYGVSGYQAQNITQVGYGQGGVWNGTAAAAGNAYNGNNVFDARRFQNNNSTGFNGPSQNGAFFEPLVTDAVLAPSVPNATGAGYNADSGGPWFTGGKNGTITETPQNPADWNQATGTNPITGNPNPPAPPYTEDTPRAAVGANSVLNVNKSNNESAVFVLAQTPLAFPNARLLGSTQSAVPLLDLASTKLVDPNATNTQGTFEWASGYASSPITVPEPGTLSLIALGGFTLLRRRSRQ